MSAVTNAILKACLAGGDGRLPSLSRNDGIDKYPGSPKEKTEAKKTSEQGEVIHFVYPKREEEKIFNSRSQIASGPKAFPPVQAFQRLVFQLLISLASFCARCLGGFETPYQATTQLRMKKGCIGRSRY